MSSQLLLHTADDKPDMTRGKKKLGSGSGSGSDVSEQEKIGET